MSSHYSEFLTIVFIKTLLLLIVGIFNETFSNFLFLIHSPSF